MKLMTGEIGKLTLGDRQVGGFKYWTAIVNRNPVNTEVRTMSYWMFEKVNTDKLSASFYAEVDKNLKLIKEGGVVVNLPNDYSIDVLIKKPLKMAFEEGFDWRE